MVRDGRLKAPAHVQFVFGLKNALPPKREILAFEVAQLKEVLPGATWTAAGIGRSQLELNHWALELGGHCRTGLEDNIRFDKARLARSEEHTSELQSLMRSSYAVFCLKKKNKKHETL